MLKTKVIKILPLWLIGLILICGIQVLAAVIFNGTLEVAAKAEPAPQVLGAETSIRGETLEPTSTPIVQTSEPNTSAVKAKSFLVFDLATGQELMDKNSTEKLYIASLTKLMTGLVSYQNLDLNQSATLTAEDILKVSPDLDYPVGESIKISDLFNSMLVGSCNDAALALGDHVGEMLGDDFPDLMNKEAQALGMDDSHFSNPMGFDSAQNYSTAQDLKKLITATQNLAAFKNLGRRTSYQFVSDSGNSYSIEATNTLIKNYSDLEAIKTGYTNEAGGAMATKLEVPGHEVVIVVLDSPNRESDTLKLRDLVLQDFNW